MYLYGELLFLQRASNLDSIMLLVVLAELYDVPAVQPLLASAESAQIVLEYCEYCAVRYCHAVYTARRCALRNLLSNRGHATSVPTATAYSCQFGSHACQTRLVSMYISRAYAWREILRAGPRGSGTIFVYSVHHHHHFICSRTIQQTSVFTAFFDYFVFPYLIIPALLFFHFQCKTFITSYR